MTSPIFDSHRREHSILEQIHEGMTVFDANNHKLGKVDYVHFGEVSPEAAEVGDMPGTISPPHDLSDNLVALVERAFGKDDLPKELRDRLLEYGFIRVDVPGLLVPDRYVLPDQITQVTSDGVVLRATRQELIKE